MAEKGDEGVKESGQTAESVWYRNARREWNERYGSYVARAKAWRLTAIAALIVAAIAVAGIAWIGAQSKVVPYIVQIDKEGTAVAMEPAEQARGIEGQDRVVKAMLARWISDLRMVTPDVNLEKRAIHEVYSHLNKTDPAEAEINGYFTENNPFERAAKELVAVEIKGVLGVSRETWQVEWDETSRDRRGAMIGRKRMKAMLTIEIIPPQNEETIRDNPIGLYVRNVDWTKEL
jgi:type IV secretory pathway TrbF-like protein